jgi:hypothetical protein
MDPSSPSPSLGLTDSRPTLDTTTAFARALPSPPSSEDTLPTHVLCVWRSSTLMSTTVPPLPLVSSLTCLCDSHLLSPPPPSSAGNGTEEIVRNLSPRQTFLPLPSSWAPVTQLSYKPWLNERDSEEVFFASLHLFAGPSPSRPPTLSCHSDPNPSLSLRGALLPLLWWRTDPTTLSLCSIFSEHPQPPHDPHRPWALGCEGEEETHSQTATGLL